MTLYRAVVAVLVLVAAAVIPLPAQIASAGPEEPSEGAEAPPLQDIPRSYRTIALGMSPDEVKELLADDPWFDWRGEEDVSLLERPRASLIDAGGSLFIDRGLFQFENDALAAIILELDPQTIDWFTLYTTLETRYGAPLDMSPARVWWEDGRTRLALERPLSVKYLDLEVFDAAAVVQTDRAAWRERARQEFLDEF